LVSPTLTLNVTCPSYATVALPNIDHHGIAYDTPVTRYVGGLDEDAQYNFPAFYPTFE